MWHVLTAMVAITIANLALVEQSLNVLDELIEWLRGPGSDVEENISDKIRSSCFRRQGIEDILPRLARLHLESGHT